jgi:tRNA-specific 2-thiouridylase
MKPLIAVAMSGGVDSLTAAFLLKEHGYPLIAIHFLTGFDTADTNLIRSMTEQLDIALHIIDCREEFEQTVVLYFTDTYARGQTPNPCLICNPRIKFGKILDSAKQLGASFLATGHYARIRRDDAGKYHLHQGADSQKDQSYFLAFLSQEQLAHIKFPLGDMSKAEVKQLAAEKGLIPSIQKESQDVCFIWQDSYAEFLEERGFEAKPGQIVTTDGKVIGRHQGLHRFTIGQRKGINCPASEPYYVIRMDAEYNRLIVGFKKEVLFSQCRVSNIHWINPPSSFPAELHTRVRYRHRAASSLIFPTDDARVLVKFHQPQEAITPGQGAVFYHGDEVLGGGFIGSG